MFQAYSFCPRSYYERYEYVPELSVGPSLSGPAAEVLPVLQEIPRADIDSLSNRPSAPLGIELDEPRPDRDFGTRFHQLVENQRRSLLALPSRVFPVWPDAAIEAECQATFAAYQAHYVVEPCTFLSAERTLRISIPGTRGADGQPHGLIVKLDGHVRHSDGTIGPLDTKTQSPSSTANDPENWAARTQASFYLWALGQLYPGENVSHMVVDLVTRGNSKRAPVFRRMADICRSKAQLDDAILCLTEVADSIERDRARGWYRADMNRCKDGWKKCSYYALHVYGRTEANLAKYRRAEQYLEL